MSGIPIPDDRRIAWAPGIPGGIPALPVFADVRDEPFGAKGDGTTDDTQAIQRAIDECPVGMAILLPAGTYRLTTTLRLNKGVALRGAGPKKTRLINEATTNHIIAIGSRDTGDVVKILAGHSKGSTSILVEDASQIRPGDLLLIDQLNDPELVDIQGCGGTCRWASREDGKRAMGQLVLVEEKNGDSLGISHPLYFTFKAELAPELVRMKNPVRGAGVEDLHVEMAQPRSDSGSSITIEHGVHCWVKNIESDKTWWCGHVTLRTCLGCEVRDSYLHHTHRFGSGHGYGVAVSAQSTDTLVENNIFHYLNCGMMLESGGCGNVFAYNFSTRMFGRDHPDTAWAHGDFSSHGAHPYMNLFEGNSVSMIACDFYWGSASHNTFFRNHADMACLRADDQTSMIAIIAMRLDAKNHFMNVLGNVFGHPGTTGVVETARDPDYGQKLVWRLGYKTPSGSGAPDDPKTAQTLLRHGNLDFINQQVGWDASIPGQWLPASLYRSAKPAFFGDLPWPIIGPDLDPVVASIPAQRRFMGMRR